MRKINGIGLFFVYTIFLLLIGIFIDKFCINHTKKEEIIISEQEKEVKMDHYFPVQVIQEDEVISEQTIYLIHEIDVEKNTEVTIQKRIPDLYLGMNREKFLISMKKYEEQPPLCEMERGFLGLNVENFSPKKVEVNMFYHYIAPTKSYYLAVKDNQVVVLLEDKKTIFIYTGIDLSVLPSGLQLKVMNMHCLENDEALYDFLEAYSS